MKSSMSFLRKMSMLHGWLVSVFCMIIFTLQQKVLKCVKKVLIFVKNMCDLIYGCDR